MDDRQWVSSSKDVWWSWKEMDATQLKQGRDVKGMQDVYGGSDRCDTPQTNRPPITFARLADNIFWIKIIENLSKAPTEHPCIFEDRSFKKRWIDVLHRMRMMLTNPEIFEGFLVYEYDSGDDSGDDSRNDFKDDSKDDESSDSEIWP